MRNVFKKFPYSNSESKVILNAEFQTKCCIQPPDD